MSYGGNYNNNNYNQGYSDGGYEQQRPYGQVDYHSANAGAGGQNNNPYTYEYQDSSVHLAQPSAQGYGGYSGGGGDGGYSGAGAGAVPSAAYVAPKKGTSKWIKIGIPLLLLVIAGGAAAGILISRNNKDDDKKPSSSNTGKNNTTTGTDDENAASAGTPAGSGTSTGNGKFFSQFDPYFQPVYPSSDNPALFATPSFASGASATANGGVAWPADPFKPAAPLPTVVRTDRPRLIAPKYKWDALTAMIAADPYMKSFDEAIMKNASEYWALPRVRYYLDGDSGILDISREKKQRIKAYSYAWRRTQDSKWVDAAWKEINHAMGTADDSDWLLTGTEIWNPTHFLDTAEMTAAFAIAYDWMYDGLSDERKTAMRTAMINNGLNLLYTVGHWWNGTTINGNWNCVCNGGLTMGALAILGDDTSGIAEKVLGTTIPNGNSACVNAPTSDGTWRESPNYWYFGTTGHTEFAASLISATGSDHGLLSTNKNFKLTGLYHMYVTGMTSLFDWADHGPNKFSTTANSMIFYGSAYNEPRYTLFQRDRWDATEPFTMFYYDPSVRGAFWNGLPLDHFFDDPTTQWVSMRSSWSDNTGTYVAFKSSELLQYQTHGDLDCGDFVFDAMGQRWFGELGSADYLAPGYFLDEPKPDARRWTYYRKMSQGQNTILVNNANQVLTAKPIMKFQSTGDAQSSNPTMTLNAGSTAYAVSDMSSAYSGSTVKRGIRFINNRKQVVIQDEITATGAILWRAHTNATITATQQTATLELKGKKMIATILSPADAVFTSVLAVRLPNTGTPEEPDQENKDVSVLTISLPAGTYTISVLFAPQWDGGEQLTAPSVVALDSWTLKSHP